MTLDKSTLSASRLTNPAAEAEAITPADTDLDQYTRALYVGTAGDVVVVMGGNDATITFTGVLAGSILPIRVSQVTSATTASDIVALY